MRITNSVIHTDHGSETGFATADAVLVRNSTDVLIQGNQLSNSASSVLAISSPRLRIVGNYSLNPLGPFPASAHFNLTNGSDDSEVTDNFGEQIPRFRGPVDDFKFIEDAVNVFQTGRVLIARNYFRDGDARDGCGIVAGDYDGSVPGDGVTIVDNVLIRTSNCGITVVGGSNHIVQRNRILDTNFVGASGNVGIAIWNYRGRGTCSNITVEDNIISNLLPNGTYWDYWDGSGLADNFRCKDVTFRNNKRGRDARAALTPEPPPPPIPPKPYS